MRLYFSLQTFAFSYFFTKLKTNYARRKERQNSYKHVQWRISKLKNLINYLVLIDITVLILLKSEFLIFFSALDIRLSFGIGRRCYNYGLTRVLTASNQKRLEDHSVSWHFSQPALADQSTPGDSENLVEGKQFQ